jgi:PAS domain S-box-containing protein
MHFHNYRWVDLPLNVAVATLYVLFAKIGLFFALPYPTITIFWPAGGFALALLLLAGTKYLSGIFAGAFFCGLMAGDSISVSAAIAAGNTLEPFAAYWLLTRHFKFHRGLDTRQDFFKLTLAAGIIASATSALMGPTALWFEGVITAGIYPIIVLRWWMGDLLGIVFLTPLILIWAKPHQQVHRKMEVFTLFLLTFLAGQILFFDWFKSLAHILSPSIAWIIPLIIWSGLRAGRHNTAVLQLMIFIQALWGASHGSGHYAYDIVESGLVNFWMFGMVVALGGMALAVISAETTANHRRWRRLHKSISSSLNEVYLFDAETLRFFFTNKGARQNLGYSKHELALMTPLDLKPLHSEQSFQKLISPLRRRETDMVVFETLHKRKDSSVYPIEVHLQLIVENDKKYFQPVEYFQAIILDITERKKYEQLIVKLNNQLEAKVCEQLIELNATNADLVKTIEALHLSKSELKQREAKIQSIFDAAVEAIITVNKDGAIISTNAAVEAIFGYKVKELVGEHINKIMASSPIGHGCCGLPHTESQACHISEAEAVHKNGTTVPVDMTVAAHDDGLYCTAIVRDVSLRKHREQLDKAHLHQLAHVTRLGLMGEMATGIAHEINQPLTAIASYAQTSLNLIGAENPNLVKLHEIMDKIQQQALRAGLIINHMRILTKHNTNQCSVVGINHLIDEAVRLCSHGIKQSSIKLTLKLANNLPDTYVDPVQIEQVLINLIRNSIDILETKPEGQERLLAIRSRIGLDSRLHVEVKDNGAGIGEAQQQEIFKPFHTTKAEGMGMGLSICRSLIQAHGGTLDFTSQAGKGTTFYFTLPLAS